MLISVKFNFVFLCTPKCASTSVEEVLQPFSDIALVGPNYFRHTNFREYNKYIKPYLKEKARIEDIETICMVREPLSWLNSWYRFRGRHQLRNPNDPSHKNSTACLSFSDFVKAYMSSNPPPFAANIGSQFDFVKDEMDNIGVDTKFLYENVDQLTEYLGQKVGKKLSLPYRNVSPSKHYKSNILEYLSYRRRKISNLLKLEQRDTPPKVDYEISDELLDSLHSFLSRDFELYEIVKKR